MTDTKNLYDAIIVGGGPAGLTAALYLTRARFRVLVVEKDAFGGQIAITSEVVNYPGVKKASGSELTGTMREQAEAFGAEFLRAEVIGLELEGDIKTVHTGEGDRSAFAVLLATGAHPRRLGFEGEAEFAGRGVAYCATCDGGFFTDKQVFVVGGGYAAAEESLFLTKYAKHVTVMMRGEGFSCAQSIANEVYANDKVTVLPHTEIESVTGDMVLRSIRYRNVDTGAETEYTSEDDGIGVFVFAGYVPASELVRELSVTDDSGYVITDEFQQTAVPGLYAAGDVCVKPLRQVVTATGEAALAASMMERTLTVLREKTGVVPVLSIKTRSVPDAVTSATKQSEELATCPMEIGPSEIDTYSSATPSCPASTAGQPVPSVTSTLFTTDMIAQFDVMFGRMKRPLKLKLLLDTRAVAQELQSYIEELVRLSDKLMLEIDIERNAEKAIAQERPYVEVLLEDGASTGLAFHGVPGGHELTSFMLGLFNAAGPGQPIDEETHRAIAAIDRKVSIKILTTLSCTMCPEAVVSAQHIAALNDHVRADVYDIGYFPELQKRYKVMSVPCIVIDDGKTVSFGKRNIDRILELIV